MEEAGRSMSKIDNHHIIVGCNKYGMIYIFSTNNNTLMQVWYIKHYPDSDHGI